MPAPKDTPTKGRITRKVIGIGLVTGAAVGVAVSARNRVQTIPRDQPETMVDWDRATAIAITMNRTDAMSASQRRTLDGEYRALVERCLPLVSSYMGVAIASPVDRTFAFDRVDWINANVEAFGNLLAPLSELLGNQTTNKSVISAVLGTVNRQVVTAEIGMLLGYLSRRVLGQYDLALLGGEADSEGKLYFVEPNIAATEQLLNIPPAEFRLWIALHEVTHVVQFEGFTWVKPYFQSLLAEYFEFLKSDLNQLKSGVRAVRIAADRIREGQKAKQSWVESLMTPDQRQVFSRVQALMCIIEGYSNHVMNAVGQDLMPNYESIAAKFERRQRNRGWGEQMLAKLTGLDVKLEQYRLGEEFVNHVVEQRGHDFAIRLWSGPDSIPTLDELKSPDDWIARMSRPA